MPIAPTPEQPGILTPREMAALVQTELTPDHDLALEWAHTAFWTATQPHIMEQDPTLAGEIARNAAVHAELGGRPVEEVSVWLTKSTIHLIGNTAEACRERAATLYIGASILHHQVRTGRSYIGAEIIHQQFEQANNILYGQHPDGQPWDRYNTMLMRRWSAYASDEMGGIPDSLLGFVLAFHGIQTALHANREANPLRNHLKFIAKQTGANALAGLVALTYPGRNMPLVRTIRRRALDRICI